MYQRSSARPLPGLNLASKLVRFFFPGLHLGFYPGLFLGELPRLFIGLLFRSILELTLSDRFVLLRRKLLAICILDSVRLPPPRRLRRMSGSRSGNNHCYDN